MSVATHGAADPRLPQPGSESVRRKDPAPSVLFDGGSGDMLLWVPTLICLSLMMFTLLASGAAPSQDAAATQSCQQRSVGAGSC